MFSCLLELILEKSNDALHSFKRLVLGKKLSDHVLLLKHYSPLNLLKVLFHQFEFVPKPDTLVPQHIVEEEVDHEQIFVSRVVVGSA